MSRVIEMKRVGEKRTRRFATPALCSCSTQSTMNGLSAQNQEICSRDIHLEPLAALLETDGRDIGESVRFRWTKESG